MPNLNIVAFNEPSGLLLFLAALNEPVIRDRCAPSSSVEDEPLSRSSSSLILFSRSSISSFNGS